MNIKLLLEEMKYEKYIGSQNLDITSITCNSEKSEAGCIFVAIKGFRTDGHKYIQDAIKRGATAVICSYIPDRCEGNYIIVKSPRAAMAEAANIIYDKPSDKMEIIGVTGTNGKTSTTYLLRSIYDYLNEKTGIIGTMGTIIGDEKIKSDNTTPESGQIQFYLDKMVQKSIRHCFMEVSSHALELNRIDNINISVAIFTNLTRDHLDFHQTMEKYFDAKKKLFYKSKINNIINIDDEYGYRLYTELKTNNMNAVSYAIERNADIKASDLKTNINGTYFDCTINGITKRIHVKTPGRFSVLNSLGAIGGAYALGVNFDDIVFALEKNDGVPERFQILNTKLDCTVILDFAHTPDGLKNVMETINEFAEGRKVIVFGSGGERDVSRRYQLGEIAGKYCDLCILTSDNPRFEDPYTICYKIAEGIQKTHNNYKIIIEREEAINYAIDNYESKDVILLAGKSTESYQDIGVEKIPYDEITVVKKIIRLRE